MADAPTTAEYRARLILLGASNLTRGFGTVVSLARASLGGPLEVLAALGNGRSYGMPSRFLARTLPGIDGCGLWRRLEAQEAAPTHTLVTDLGNDLAFGAEPEQILGWVETCLERMGAARVVVTSLPLSSLERLRPWQFDLWAKLFFPGRGVRAERVLPAAVELDAGIRALARSRGLTLVEPRREWFGPDPIHYARARKAQAWAAYLSSWSGGEPVEPDGRAVPLPPAETRRVLGIRLDHPQPGATLADGTTISVY